MSSQPTWINAAAGEPSYDAAELRRADAVQLYPGVAEPFGARQGVRPGHEPVSLAGTTWTVEDLTAVVYPALTTQSGAYRVQHPSEAGALDPADGSNARIDALDLQVQDDDEDASTFRRAQVVYVAGTPAATPSAPAVTANSLRLATILVSAGGSPSPVLTIVAPFTVASGGVMPVRGTSELPAAGRYEGMLAYRQDDGTLRVWDGATWAAIAGTGVGTAAVQDEETGFFDFTNARYAAQFTTGTFVNCWVPFVAPASGKVMIHYGGTINITAGTGASAYMAPVVRTGGTVGLGTIVLSGSDVRAVRIRGAADPQTDSMGRSTLVSGLVPGDTYNARLEHGVTSQTGTLGDRSIQVVPTT